MFGSIHLLQMGVLTLTTCSRLFFCFWFDNMEKFDYDMTLRIALLKYLLSGELFPNLCCFKRACGSPTEEPLARMIVPCRRLHGSQPVPLPIAPILLHRSRSL